MSRLRRTRSELFQFDRLGQEQMHPASERLPPRRDVAQASDGDDRHTRAAALLLEVGGGARSLEAVHDGHVDAR